MEVSIKKVIPWAVLLNLAAGLFGSVWGESVSGSPATEEELLFLEIPTVVTASRMEQPVTDAPASVTVITAEDIRAYGYRTLADILNSVRGMYVTYDRNYQYLGVRGFNRPGDYNSRVLLLVDGYRVNDAVYDTASIGTEFFLDVDLIDRVEVVRGPGSSVYGSNAVFGVVNVITQRGGDFNGREVSGEGASFGAGKGRLTYGRRYDNGSELLLSTSYFQSRGRDLFFPEFDAPGTNNGVVEGLDSERYARVFAKAAYRDFSLTAAYSERDKEVPTASFGSVFNDSRLHMKDSQAVFDLGYNRGLSERLDLSAHLFYGGYFFHGFFPYDQPPVTVNKDQALAEWRGVQANLTGRLGRHRFVTGGEYQDNFRQDHRNLDLDPPAIYQNDQRRSWRAGLFLQDEITLREGLLLNAGLRYDHYSGVEDMVNPRAGVIYTPRRTTTFKFLYGSAFRAPNTYELYISGGAFKANPGLESEKITTYEIVAEHQPQSNLRLTASAYWNKITNLINQVTDPADDLLVFRNIGEFKAEGVEFETEYVWANEARLRGSYARQITRDETTGEELENSPRHLAKLNASLPVFDDAFRIGTELRYTSRRKTLGGGSTDDFLIVNLTVLSQRLAEGLELSGAVFNLFDAQYADPGRPEHVQDAIPQDGRTFRVKMTYSFESGNPGVLK